MKTERNQKWTGNGTNFCHFVGGREPASSVAGSCHRGRIQATPVESHPRIDRRTTSESYSRSYQTRQRGQINNKKWRNEWREWWIIKRWNVLNLLMFYSIIEYLEILPIWARHSRRSLPTSPHDRRHYISDYVDGVVGRKTPQKGLFKFISFNCFIKCAQASRKW